MPAQHEIPAATRAQSADAVLMVRPASFGWNPQTGVSNHFQPPRPPAVAGDPGARAIAEFDGLAAALVQAGVEVHALADLPEPAHPDAVFPNNWVSLHADGTVVLYPMLAENRRGERRLELLQELERRGAFVVTRLLDLTHHESQGRFLAKAPAASCSITRRASLMRASLLRTDEQVLGELCDELGYQGVVFHAAGPDGSTRVSHERRACVAAVVQWSVPRPSRKRSGVARCSSGSRPAVATSRRSASRR